MMYKTPTLETERLILKRGTYEDYLKVYEYNFTRLMNIGGEFEFVKNDPESIKGFETEADEKENVLDFIIYLKDSLIPIGNIVYDRYDEARNSLEIAYNLHPNYWRKGYMTEAVLESMKYVYSNLDIDNIICAYAEENYKSKGVNDKIGFEYSGSELYYNERLNKDIKQIETIMSKDRFNELYKNKTK